MVENKCGQPGLWTLKLTVSQQRDDETNWFFACFYNFTQIKGWLKVFGVNMVKNRFEQSGEGTLKFTVSEEWTDGMYKLIFYMLIHDHQKLKADQKFFRWAWSEMGVASHGTQKWAAGIKSFFHAGTNLGKLKVDSTIFGMP